ncbi:MAG: hypothetical protein R8K20_08515 [Gallionellaceae bacterium]
MFKLPVSIIYAMIAFNITAFTVFLLLDMLIFTSIVAKIISVALSIGSWSMVYIKRKKFIALF